MSPKQVVGIQVVRGRFVYDTSETMKATRSRHGPPCLRQWYSVFIIYLVKLVRIYSFYSFTASAFGPRCDVKCVMYVR